MDLITAAPTMTSREIAELVESRHDSVKRTIERLAEGGVISKPPMVDGPKAANGVTEKHYLIGKRDSYVIVAQLSPEFTARLVDRWQELEAVASKPMTHLETARMLVLSLERAEQAESALAAAAPKIEYAEALLNADGTTLVRDVAKTVGVGVRKLESALKSKGVILANNAPAAVYVSKGYFKEETHAYETKTRGTQIGHTARVTGLGIEFLRRFISRNAAMFGLH